MKPVEGKAEVGIEFPDKSYMGSFGAGAKLDCHADAHGVVIRLLRTDGEKREVDLHLRYELMAEILDELAESLATQRIADPDRRAAMAAAAKRLVKSLG
jgi:hypothetical protein